MKELFQKFQEFIEKSNVSGIIIALISFALLVLISFTQFYEGFEARLYDFRFQLKPSIEEWEALVFVDIDENSINNVGKFPWPRHYYGTGLGVLHEMGVRQAAFDIEFPDRSPQMINFPLLVRLKDQAERGRVNRKDLDRIVLNNDQLLAEGIALMEKVILPFHFQKDILVEQDYDEGYLRQGCQPRRLQRQSAAYSKRGKSLRLYRSVRRSAEDLRKVQGSRFCRPGFPGQQFHEAGARHQRGDHGVLLTEIRRDVSDVCQDFGQGR